MNTNGSFKLPSHKAPVTLPSEIATFVGTHPKATLEQICTYVGKSQAYVRSGLAIANMLGMVQISVNDGFLADKECLEILGMTPSQGVMLSAIQKHVYQWEPFIVFIQFAVNGTSIDEATRKVHVLYSFLGKEEVLQGLFLSWGEAFKTFEVNGDKLIIASELQQARPTTLGKIERVEDEISIRLELSNRLGVETFTYLLHDEVQELVDAVKKLTTDSRGAIECTARALEDFLRRIAIEVGVDVSRDNGISQVVNHLYNNKNSSGVLDNKIHNKHYSIGSALGDIRNMAGHGKEAKTMERWALHGNTGGVYLDFCLHFIRSVHLFIHKRQLTF